MSSGESETLGRPVRIGQIAVPVADVDRAVAWYADVLGLRLLFRVPPGLAFFDCGGVRLMLSRPEGPEPPSRAGVLYYLVPDIAAAHAALAARGAVFVDAPHLVARLPDHDLWMAFCRDSEGNLLGLMSEVRPPSADAH
jgi:methylmalonyl-CoA/ethylmalonyl-CoA epimerase